MTEVNITEMARNFSDYINRVAYSSERFTILRNNKPVAQISPLPTAKTLGEMRRILAEMVSLSLEEAADFEKDLGDIRRESNEQPVVDPWASS